MALRLLFFGTPAFAVPSLDRLAASPHQVVAVVTQPDRPRGRGQRTTAAPVKARAVELGLPVLQPERLKDPALIETLRGFAPDLAVVAAYGRLLPQPLLELPRLGMINVHASLLPRWRGAAPVHRAVLAGDSETGVTIMRVVPALDAGPMLARAAVPIGADETSVELEARLAVLGADLVTVVVDRLDAGTVPEEPQDETLATYAPRLQKQDGAIDWTRTAAEIHNQIRGLQPWPQGAARWHGRRVIFKRSELISSSAHNVASGTIVAVEADRLQVAAGDGLVGIRELQSEGGAAMSVRAWQAGHSVRAGDRFESLPVTP